MRERENVCKSVYVYGHINSGTLSSKCPLGNFLISRILSHFITRKMCDAALERILF